MADKPLVGIIMGSKSDMPAMDKMYRLQLITSWAFRTNWSSRRRTVRRRRFTTGTPPRQTAASR